MNIVAHLDLVFKYRTAVRKVIGEPNPGLICSIFIDTNKCSLFRQDGESTDRIARE